MLAIMPPPGEAMAGCPTAVGCGGAGATAFGGGGGGAARRTGDGDDLPRPIADPRDGDERLAIVCDFLSSFQSGSL